MSHYSKSILVLIALFVGSTLFAQSNSLYQDENFIYRLDGQHLVVKDYKHYHDSLKTEVTISDFLVIDGEKVFVTVVDRCPGKYLERINLPMSLVSIEEAAFGGCINLEEIEFPNSLYSIGNGAFFGCSRLKKIYIPERVGMIGFNVFGKCTNLEEIKVSPKNKAYDSRDNCNAIIQTNINVIIAGCKKTKILKSVKEIAQEAFYGCDIQKVVIPQNIKNIGAQAFGKCKSMREVVIEKGCKEIGPYAFMCNHNLSKVTLPDGLLCLREGAFADCPNLNVLKVGKGLKEIGCGVFDPKIIENNDFVFLVPRHWYWEHYYNLHTNICPKESILFLRYPFLHFEQFYIEY